MAILAGASILGGAISSNQAAQAAKGAANTQAQAAAQGVAEQRRQFDITQESLQPFQQAGQQALTQQQAFLG